MELLIGCGQRREKILHNGTREWTHLVTLDIDPTHNPDIVHDLNALPYPFAENTFDEIHAYEVLEHCGRQGDAVYFFAQFTEFHRILKPGGFLCGTVPRHDREWAWGDPGHTRVFIPQTFLFLSQREYQERVGKTPMSDYRSMYKADFETTYLKTGDSTLYFVLKAQKEADSGRAS